MNKELEPTPLTSVTIESFENENIESLFVPTITNAYEELRVILPALPQNLKVRFAATYEYGQTGVTGNAVRSDTINVGIKPGVEDRSKQFGKIRSLIFHEGFHLAQGFYYEGKQFSALESAIYEGCGTIFERDYADSNPAWGNYSGEDEETLQRWYEEMKTVTAEQYFEASGETWRKWAFYDEETGESWRVYKVGTWLVDTILKKEDMDIIELSSKMADDILSYLK